MDIEHWKKKKKELHWTHDDLARESGVSRRTIAGIFGGDPRYDSPTFNTIRAIEKALGIVTDNQPPNTEPELTDAQKRLLKAFDSLVPPMQDYILEMTENLVAKQDSRSGTVTTGKKHA